MRLITLEQAHDFYFDIRFEMQYGNINLLNDVIEKYDIMTPYMYRAFFVFEQKSDDFGDFCDALKKWCNVVIY